MMMAAAVTMPQINDLIGWMRKNNCAACAARFSVQFFGAVGQTTQLNFHISGSGNNVSPQQLIFHSLPLHENHSYGASERTLCLLCTMWPTWNNPRPCLEIFIFQVLKTKRAHSSKSFILCLYLKSICVNQVKGPSAHFVQCDQQNDKCKTLNPTQSSILMWCCHCSSHQRFLNSLIIYYRCCSTNVIAEIIGCVKEGGRDWTPSRMLAVILLTLWEQNAFIVKYLFNMTLTGQPPCYSLVSPQVIQIFWHCPHSAF